MRALPGCLQFVREPSGAEISGRCYGASVSHLDLWLVEGARIPVRSRQDVKPITVFHRLHGQRGPWTTFFHGFPTFSYDWARVGALLPAGRQRLYMDHLGFGFSDKPRRHEYSFDEQIDIALALWKKYKVTHTALVVHDYSVSMAQEILARINDGTWTGPEIDGILFLNGGLFFSKQTPLRIQKLLRNRWTGPVVARLVNERTFERNMEQIVHEDHPWRPGELEELWRGVDAMGGRKAYHLISRYHEERAANEARWETAMRETDVPLALAWGGADPISGAAMSAHVIATMPNVHATVWDDVGHYPQCEVPDRVAAEVVRLERLTKPAKSPKP